MLKAYPKTHSDGDMRACDDGGTSEHKDGRAWDWGADHRTKTGRAAGKGVHGVFRSDPATCLDWKCRWSPWT